MGIHIHIQLEVHRVRIIDRVEVNTPVMQDETYSSRNIATLLLLYYIVIAAI
jgi:hypothetical protein